MNTRRRMLMATGATACAAALWPRFSLGAAPEPDSTQCLPPIQVLGELLCSICIPASAWKSSTSAMART